MIFCWLALLQVDQFIMYYAPKKVLPFAFFLAHQGFKSREGIFSQTNLAEWFKNKLAHLNYLQLIIPATVDLTIKAKSPKGRGRGGKGLAIKKKTIFLWTFIFFKVPTAIKLEGALDILSTYRH